MSKVAVILTGHMRCWEQVFPNFKHHIIDQYNPDIFISTWSDEGWWRPHSQQGYNDQSPPLDVEKVSSYYNPKIIFTENYKNIEHILEQRSKQFSNYLHNPKNVVSMLYKLLSGGQLLETYIASTGQKYDLVIRMRPDMTFNLNLPKFNNNRFYTINHQNHLGQGTGDMFQVGSVDDIIKFTKLLYKLEDTYMHGGSLCPHVITKSFIEINNFIWQEIHISKTLVHSPFGSYVPSIGNSILDLKTEENNKVY